MENISPVPFPFFASCHNSFREVFHFSFIMPIEKRPWRIIIAFNLCLLCRTSLLLSSEQLRSAHIAAIHGLFEKEDTREKGPMNSYKEAALNLSVQFSTGKKDQSYKMCFANNFRPVLSDPASAISFPRGNKSRQLLFFFFPSPYSVIQSLPRGFFLYRDFDNEDTKQISKWW